MTLVSRLRPPTHLKRALGALSVLWVGTLAGSGCAFLTQILLARSLGPAGFGTFAAALNLVMLVAPLASFGLGGFWLRVFGEEGWQGRRWLRASLRYATMSTAAVLIALIGWALLGPHDDITRWMLAILSAHLLGQVTAELIGAKLQLEARYRALVLWQLLPHLARLLLLSLLAFAFTRWMSPQLVANAYLIVAVMLMVLGGMELRSMYRGRFNLVGHGADIKALESSAAAPRLREVAAQSWPFGFAAIFHLIYFQSNIIILKYLSGDEAAGMYNVAFTVMMAVYLLPSVIYQKFLIAKIHRWANHDKEKFRRYYRLGNMAMAGTGVAAMLFVGLLAPLIIGVLFGDRYGQAVIVLQILSLAIPFRFVASSVGSTMLAKGNIERKSILMGVTAAINLALNFAVIPTYGIIGSAWATVATEIVLLILYYGYSRRYVDFGDEDRAKYQGTGDEF